MTTSFLDADAARKYVQQQVEKGFCNVWAGGSADDYIVILDVKVDMAADRPVTVAVCAFPPDGGDRIVSLVNVFDIRQKSLFNTGKGMANAVLRQVPAVVK